MENLTDMEQMNLVDELTLGKELSNQLKNQFGPLTSKETCEHLLQKILSSYDKALACLNLTNLLHKDSSAIVGLLDSPESSDGVTPKIGFARVKSQGVVFKKRKTLPRWSEQIRVGSGTGVEGAPVDGHTWRKYGQKDILGATYTRAYYRCTHKYSRGCAATKQVQKMEEDPLIFEVTYRGKHSCMDVANSPSPVVSLEENPQGIINKFQKQLKPKQKQEQNMPSKFGQCLEGKTKDINAKVVERIGEIVEFASGVKEIVMNLENEKPSTSNQSENQDLWDQFEGNNILAGLGSPETTGSDYFSGSANQVLPYPYEPTDMISTPTSGTNSNFHFDIDQAEINIEPNFPFSELDYFTPDMFY